MPFQIACSSRPPPIPSGLSPALRDLATRCLGRRPGDRPTAGQLLRHPIFEEGDDVAPPDKTGGRD